MRQKIALRNLYISQAIIIVFLIFAYFVWFPYPYLEFSGFERTALMLILVDLILGPLLVYIVYKEDKKNLSWDINILLTIQICAFVFGAYSLYQKKPSYIVFVNDHFEIVNASYANTDHIPLDSLKTSLFSKPKIAFAKAPEDLNGLIQYVIDTKTNVDRKGIDKLGKYYEPYNDHTARVLEKRLNSNLLFSKDKKSASLLASFITKYGGTVDDYAFFLLIGSNHQNAIFVLNSETAEPVGIIKYDLWSALKNKKLS